MFARKLRIEIEQGGQIQPCPLDWLDHFFMRHFTGVQVADHTLPTGDGRLEAGTDVNLDALQREFEKWLRGHKLLGAEAQLKISEE